MFYTRKSDGGKDQTDQKTVWECGEFRGEIITAIGPRVLKQVSWVVTIECDFDCGVIFIDNLRLEGVRTATACGAEEKDRHAKSGWLCAVVGDKTGEGNKSEMVSKGFLTDRSVTPQPWCRDKFPGNQLRTNPSIVRYQFITQEYFSCGMTEPRAQRLLVSTI